MEQISQRVSVLCILRSFEHQAWESPEPHGLIFSVVAQAEPSVEAWIADHLTSFQLEFVHVGRTIATDLPPPRISSDEGIEEGAVSCCSFHILITAKTELSHQHFSVNAQMREKASQLYLLVQPCSVNSLKIKCIFKRNILHMRMFFDALAFLSVFFVEQYSWMMNCGLLNDRCLYRTYANNVIQKK